MFIMLSHHTVVVLFLGIFLQQNVTLARDQPFFDVTEALNTKTESEIQNVLNKTRTFYYSTDMQVTEILELSWIPKLILKNFPPEEDADFCFMLSFQITKDKKDINWNYINDIFYKLPQLNNTETQESQQILQKHICKIVLNFEADPEAKNYQLSESYAREASISFTKYTKKILKEIFGPEKSIPVGVLYTESQVMNDNILLQQEIQYADFVIVSVHLTSMSKMPLLFPQFEEYLNKVLTKNQEYLDEIISTGKKMPQNSMIIWDKFVSSLSSELERMENQNMLLAEPFYLEFLHDFITTAVRRQKGNIQVISKTLFNLHEQEIDQDQNRDSLRHIIPYLYVQESDLNPCMMIRLLLQMSQFGINSLAVNEFTWNAVVRYKEKLTNETFSKETCGCSIDTDKKQPQNIFLFISKLASMHWDKMENILKNVLSENPRIGDMNLKTVILTADNIAYWSDIKNYFLSWVTHNITSMGCQVDVTREVFLKISDGNIISRTELRCQPILHFSRLVIWSIDVSDRFISAYKFSYDFGSSSLKKGLFKMLAEREIYKRRRPEKEVIFNIITRDLKSNGNCSECDHETKMKEMDFRQSIAIWVKIHKVRILFQQAFDFKNKLNSLFEFPRQNEDGSFDRCHFTF